MKLDNISLQIISKYLEFNDKYRILMKSIRIYGRTNEIFNS